MWYQPYMKHVLNHSPLQVHLTTCYALSYNWQGYLGGGDWC